MGDLKITGEQAAKDLQIIKRVPELLELMGRRAEITAAVGRARMAFSEARKAAEKMMHDAALARSHAEGLSVECSEARIHLTEFFRARPKLFEGTESAPRLRGDA